MVRRRRRRPLAALAALIVLGLGLSQSARAAGEGAAGDRLRVYVMTFGPGDHPFNKFGHDALLVEDREAGTERVYNFGTFSFESPRLILDFLGGRLHYWLSVSSLPVVLSAYERDNRTIAVQELLLSAEAKRALQARLVDNARPENRLYRYDYFLDNCATRVRDAVDRAADGALRRSAGAPGRMTLREHALRMTARPLWFSLALDLVLGPAVDRPVDRWAEMFLPEELARGLAVATTADGGPLAAANQVVFPARRPPPLERPPARRAPFFAAGVTVGLVFLALGRAQARRRAARALLGALLVLWGLIVGFIGCFLVYVWAFTDHVVAHHNQNILLCAPWSLAFVVLGVGVGLGRPGAVRKASLVGSLAVAAVLSACVVKLGLAPYQANGALIAFFFPAWLGIAATLAWLRSRAPGESRP
jgi:hypothetical protein